MSLATKIRRQYYPSIKSGAKALQCIVTKKRMPVYASLMITQRCNLKCVYCFPDSPHREENDMPLEKIFAIIDGLYEIGTRYITVMGGEPTLRNDLDKIIDYTLEKGMMPEISTNGYAIKKWESTIKKLFLVCNSIDGDERVHDANRGEGSFKKIIESIEFCKKLGVPVQLRSVITENNIGHIDFMLDLAKKHGTTLSMGEQCGNRGDAPDVELARKYRKFWQFMKQKKLEGYLIDKSFKGMDLLINYPLDVPMDKIFMEGETLPENLPPGIPNCNIRKGFVFVDHNGMMYPCVPLFGKWGKNLFDLGIKRAWDELMEYKCLFCRSSIYDMKSSFFAGDPHTMYDTFMFIYNKNRQ